MATPQKGLIPVSLIYHLHLSTVTGPAVLALLWIEEKYWIASCPTTDMLSQNLHIKESSTPQWFTHTFIYIDLLTLGRDEKYPFLGEIIISKIILNKFYLY